MTDTPKIAEVMDLIERLTRRGNRHDDGATAQGELVNPDGPEAAKVITQARASLAEMALWYGHAAAALTKAQADIAKYREALTPFARAADYWSVFHDFQRITSLHQHGDCLEVHHLRDAVVALKGKK